MSEMVSIAILRPTVIDGEDVFPGDKLKVAAATARRLIALGKAEEVKRGRPKKNGKGGKKGEETASPETPPADEAAGDEPPAAAGAEAETDQPPLMEEAAGDGR